jgi:hypothetical protein
MVVSYLNLSRRLVRWMKQIQLPRSAIRMRYVRLVHAYHVLDGSCSHNALIYAMQTLLAGYVSVDEGDHSAQYYRLLREAIQELQELVKQYAENA